MSKNDFISHAEVAADVAHRKKGVPTWRLMDTPCGATYVFARVYACVHVCVCTLLCACD